MALTRVGHVSKSGLMTECVGNCFAAAQSCEWRGDECIQSAAEGMDRCIERRRDVADMTMHAFWFVTRTTVPGLPEPVRERVRGVNDTKPNTARSVPRSAGTAPRPVSR